MPRPWAGVVSMQHTKHTEPGSTRPPVPGRRLCNDRQRQAVQVRPLI
jgi:hypothetical protein